MTDLVEWIEPFLGDSYRQQVDSNRRSAHPDHSAKSRIETEFDISNLYIRQEVRQRVQVIEVIRPVRSTASAQLTRIPVA